MPVALREVDAARSGRTVVVGAAVIAGAATAPASPTGVVAAQWCTRCRAVAQLFPSAV